MTCEHKAPARSAACGRGWPPGSKRRSSSRRPGTGPRTSPGGGQAVLLWRWGGVLPPTIVRGEAKSRWWGCVQLPLPGNATAGAYGGVEVRAEVKPKKKSTRRHIPGGCQWDWGKHSVAVQCKQDISQKKMEPKGKATKSRGGAKTEGHLCLGTVEKWETWFAVGPCLNWTRVNNKTSNSFVTRYHQALESVLQTIDTDNKITSTKKCARRKALGGWPLPGIVPTRWDT